MYYFLHKLIRIFLILFLVFVLGWLAWKKLVPSGSMEAVYGMSKESPFISKLYPKDRVSDAKRDEDNYYRAVLAEPVYFNLKPSGDFDEARVLIKYKYLGEGDLKFGGLINKENWSFDFVEMPRTEKGEWGALTANFNLSDLVKEKENFRFMFSSPELISGQLEIDEVRVVFEREIMTFGEMISKIIEAIKWRMN
ncbi:hypothetical protein A2316_03465 [Candidatus Falkowbacteria bacterium RIFOXYB2_FULL_38_15]|uniref:Uncharacterized protein n=1 Tax=Candidatus Falkowbacteria bacterium RIFOXYA2_FULL_38_12 TaxID=1797993 RepID=A0A1F5S3D6_9BACT|nr:MAG: hypothetical protein A2257_01760 [Candidatus Falkowbacteria bacterium RIFOXYA2_FULL_38_12]OGF32977.1 MAG: hypothetical protein A2316_03465 [Candidatus Falkowbacteria bacterium RIFOXYB2_FULL_38_15]OGF42625.1 MAG: hypothetical protein A2555_02475 [Candidatus Falkowbacteria bacterium RIFOXYD2_FULL_39_16]